MAADAVYAEMEMLFADSEGDEGASSSSSEGEEVGGDIHSEEPEEDAEVVAQDWQADGQLPRLPFNTWPHINAGTAESPIDYFKLLFNVTFMATLVQSINTHAVQVLLETDQFQSRIFRWHETNIDEMYTFLGLLFHMGHIRISRINDYWNTNPLFKAPFAKYMSRDRFLLILRNLSFTDPNLTFDSNDPSRFTKPIISFFNSLMKLLVVPPKNLTIDETVVLWRGRLKIKQYIQGKRHKYGVKLYVLTDTNGITQKIHMYCGTHDVELRGKGHADKVVMMLMEDYLNVGHSLYMDNFYNSVTLAEDLLAKNTYVTGTLRANRSRNPCITKMKLKRGDLLSRYNSRGVCVSNFKDKRNVIMISTEHDSHLVNHTNKYGKISQKPEVVVKYNENMKGVDRKDQLLAYYPCYNKSTRWYKKILVHVMQVMLLNAFMLYNVQPRPSDNKIRNFYDYRLEIVRNLLKIKETNRQTNAPTVKTANGDDIHVAESLPKNIKGRTKRKDCRYCLDHQNVRKATLFYCPQCPKRPGLCLGNCFRKFHRY